MLNIVTGRAKSGKSGYIIKEIVKLAEEGIGAILIVPEQQTHDVERAVLSALGNRLASGVNVLSFRRLVNYVFRQTGPIARRYLDEGGRLVVMRSALGEIAGSLRHFRSAAGSASFARYALRFVSEAGSYLIDGKSLFELSGRLMHESPELSDKLYDAGLILGAYAAALENGYADMVDDFPLLADILSTNPVLEGKHIYIDGFSGFTPGEYLVLDELISQAAGVTVSITGNRISDGPPPETDMFHTGWESARRLIELARKRDVAVATPVHLERGEGAFSPAIGFIEEHLFAPGSERFEGDPSSVGIYTASGKGDECEYIARTVLSLVRDEGYRYRDIAVTVRSMENYGPYLDAAFRRYGIPALLDVRRGILGKPLCVLILSAFEILTSDFGHEQVFTYLKSGLAGLTHDEVLELEEYSYAWKLGGSDWRDRSPFSRHPLGYGERADGKIAEKLLHLTSLRDRVRDPLIRFEKGLESRDVKEISAAVYRLLVDLGVPEAVERVALELERFGEMGDAAEYRQVWDMVMVALDQMTIAVTAETNASEYAELFRSILSEADVGIIPTSLDQVTIGGADRMRAAGKKCSIVCGLSEGDFPNYTRDYAIVDERERRTLRMAEIELSPSGDRVIGEERMYLYFALTAGSRRLILTSPGTRRSSLMAAIRGMIPGVSDLTRDLLPPEEKIVDARSAVDYLLAFEEEELADRLISLLQRDPASYRIYQIAKSAAEKPDEAVRVTGETERSLLLPPGGSISPTRIDRYVMCPFGYFCDYPLGLKLRHEIEFDALQRGNFLHYALESLLGSGADRFVELFQGNPREAEAEIGRVVDSYTAAFLPEYEGLPARTRYRFSHMRRTLMEFCTVLAAELKNSGFRPLDFELELGGGETPPMVIGEGSRRVTVRGRIDRVDGYERNGILYLRVADYKSGAKKLDLAEVYSGIGTQVLLYLYAVCDIGYERYGMETRPAGAVYSPVRFEPISGKDRRMTSDMAKKARKTEKNGLLLRDDEIIEAMDYSGEYATLPVVLSKSGGYDPFRSSVASNRQLEYLRSFLENNLLAATGRIENGDVDINPLKGKGRSEIDACRYCGMRPICRHSSERGRTRAPSRINPSEFWNLIGGGDEND